MTPVAQIINSFRILNPHEQVEVARSINETIFSAFINSLIRTETEIHPSAPVTEWERLIIEYHQHFKTGFQPFFKHPYIRQACERFYQQNAFQLKITEKVAKEIGVSTSVLYSLFKRDIGVPPQTIFKWIVFKLTCQDLENPASKIYLIADNRWNKKQKLLYSAFYKFLNKTPGEYKDEIHALERNSIKSERMTIKSKNSEKIKKSKPSSGVFST